jgi:hypothetical protein
MARMKAKYSGKCAASGCGARFRAGADIVYNRNAPKGRKTLHAACAIAAGQTGNDYADSASAARGVSYEVRTSGGTFYRNYAGRCEDAPCCGCCTI